MFRCGWIYPSWHGWDFPVFQEAYQSPLLVRFYLYHACRVGRRTDHDSLKKCQGSLPLVSSYVEHASVEVVEEVVLIFNRVREPSFLSYEGRSWVFRRTQHPILPLGSAAARLTDVVDVIIEDKESFAV